MVEGGAARVPRWKHGKGGHESQYTFPQEGKKPDWRWESRMVISRGDAGGAGVWAILRKPCPPAFRKVKPAEAETAGAIMAFFLSLGLALGAVFSFLCRSIV